MKEPLYGLWKTKRTFFQLFSILSYFRANHNSIAKQQMKICKVIPTTSVESWVDCQRVGKRKKGKIDDRFSFKWDSRESRERKRTKFVANYSRWPNVCLDIVLSLNLKLMTKIFYFLKTNSETSNLNFLSLLILTFRLYCRQYLIKSH